MTRRTHKKLRSFSGARAYSGFGSGLCPSDEIQARIPSLLSPLGNEASFIFRGKDVEVGRFLEDVSGSIKFRNFWASRNLDAVAVSGPFGIAYTSIKALKDIGVNVDSEPGGLFRLIGDIANRNTPSVGGPPGGISSPTVRIKNKKGIDLSRNWAVGYNSETEKNARSSLRKILLGLGSKAESLIAQGKMSSDEINEVKSLYSQAVGPMGLEGVVGIYEGWPSVRPGFPEAFEIVEGGRGPEVIVNYANYKLTRGMAYYQQKLIEEYDFRKVVPEADEIFQGRDPGGVPYGPFSTMPRRSDILNAILIALRRDREFVRIYYLNVISRIYCIAFILAMAEKSVSAGIGGFSGAEPESRGELGSFKMRSEGDGDAGPPGSLAPGVGAGGSDDGGDPPWSDDGATEGESDTPMDDTTGDTDVDTSGGKSSAKKKPGNAALLLGAGALGVLLLKKK